MSPTTVLGDGALDATIFFTRAVAATLKDLDELTPEDRDSRQWNVTCGCSPRTNADEEREEWA